MNATVLEEPAPAKVNLALHITGRRPDGYHLLDSLVVFPGIGDRLAASAAPDLSLTLDGPFAPALAEDPDNLVIRAARLIARPGTGAALRLTKTLPVASGIGGGSADAAASLRLLCRLHGTPMPDQAAILALGADVPVCLASRAARMSGIGERLDPLVLPTFWIVLANPGQPVSTGAVFAGLARTDGAPLPALPAFADAPALFAWLAATRNDLERPAIDHLPVIATLRSALAAQPGCALARMSGSGATCFGLFADEPSARAAAAVLARAEPGWWLAAAPVPASGSA